MLRARVTDPDGRPNLTEMTRWVSGGKLPAVAKVEKEAVRLVADKVKYAPGDTAELLVQAPFAPAEGLMTVRRAGILVEQRFSMKDSTTVLKVPLTEAHYPSLQVQVDLVGAAARIDARGEPDPKLPKRPAYASGTVSLSIPPTQQKLKVKVTPRPQKLLPGGNTVIDLLVKDAAGKAVSGGVVALLAVDEAVLALTGYKVHSPLSTFYPYRSPDVWDRYLREHVRLMDPLQLAEKLRAQGESEGRQRKFAVDAAPSAGAMSADEAKSAPGGIGSGARPPSPSRMKMAKEERSADAPAQPAGPAIRVRQDFKALAVFSPAVRTDGEGRAQVAVKLPDSLTRYRVMAVAVAGATHYGYGESTVTAQQPLMLRPQPPRFLNFGDQFEFPVVIQNQSDAALTVEVAVRGSNVVFTGAAGQRVEVPANDRREVRFPARAAEPGIARFQVAAAAGNWVDAAERELPVWTPATTEAFATYGTLDQGAAVQPVAMPKGVFKEFGGLEVSTSSTALQALTDAVVYLFSYPYECSEQIRPPACSPSPRSGTCSRPSRPRGSPPRSASRPRWRGTSSGSRTCRTTTVGGGSGFASSAPGPSSPST